MKDKEAALQFLEEKLRLIRPSMVPEIADGILHVVYANLRANIHQMPYARQTLLSADDDLEEYIAKLLLPEQVAALRKTLVQRFGFSSLGRTPDRVLKSVLSKGRISNEREARVVLDRLDDQIQPGFGSDEYLTLSKMMGEYETRQK